MKKSSVQTKPQCFTLPERALLVLIAVVLLLMFISPFMGSGTKKEVVDRVTPPPATVVAPLTVPAVVPFEPGPSASPDHR